jgi:hypothetical protein
VRTKSNLNKSREKSKSAEEPKTSNKIIQAISMARKQNPKVSFE